MGWQENSNLILRNLIWDNVDPVAYTDSRLNDVLIVAAYQIVAENKFLVSYTVDVDAVTITPDPINDVDFIYLMTLKAACMIDRGSLRLAAAINGIEARCGPAVMKVVKRMDGFSTLIDKGYCGVYEEARLQYGFGNLNFASAILSPFVNDDFCAEDLNLSGKRQRNINYRQ